VTNNYQSILVSFYYNTGCENVLCDDGLIGFSDLVGLPFLCIIGPFLISQMISPSTVLITHFLKTLLRLFFERVIIFHASNKSHSIDLILISQ
jgi:hypothetical protein